MKNSVLVCVNNTFLLGYTAIFLDIQQFSWIYNNFLGYTAIFLVFKSGEKDPMLIKFARSE